MICGEKPQSTSPEEASRKGAFRQVKRDKNIPVSQQPDSVGPNLDRRGMYRLGVPTSIQITMVNPSRSETMLGGINTQIIPLKTEGRTLTMTKGGTMTMISLAYRQGAAHRHV